MKTKRSNVDRLLDLEIAGAMRRKALRLEERMRRFGFTGPIGESFGLIKKARELEKRAFS